jgi:hypothetical protein
MVLSLLERGGLWQNQARVGLHPMCQAVWWLDGAKPERAIHRKRDHWAVNATGRSLEVTLFIRISTFELNTVSQLPAWYLKVGYNL